MNFVGIMLVFICLILPEAVLLCCLAFSAVVTWRTRFLLSYLATAAIFITLFWSLFDLYQIYCLGVFQVVCSPLTFVWIGIGVFAGQLLWAARKRGRLL